MAGPATRKGQPSSIQYHGRTEVCGASIPQALRIAIVTTDSGALRTATVTDSGREDLNHDHQLGTRVEAEGRPIN